MENFLSIIVSGFLVSNCLVSTCSGIDVSVNKTKDLKNASIYSLVIFCVLLASSITLFVTNKILEYFGQANLLFLIAIVCIAGFVQIAEFVTKKVAPRFYQEIAYFIPILACNLFLLLLSTSFSTLSFAEMLLNVVANGVGIFSVLGIIAGIKNNYFFKKDGAVNPNISALIVVFVLIIIWTAF